MTVLRLLIAISLVSLASAKHIPRLEPDIRHHRGQDELWLEDFERLSQDQVRPVEMQADAPPPDTTGAQLDGCPPPAADEEQKCDEGNARECMSDADCKSTEKCCYNPCTNGNTCRMFPAVVDWIREPKRKEDGNSWLIESEGVDYPYDYEDDPDWCSTTPPDEDEDALLCPHGYVCQVEFPGDPSQDIPNRGHCVLDDSHNNQLEPEEDIFSNNDLESSRVQTSDIRQLLPRELLDSGVCVYENSIITEGKTFAFHGLPCKCRDGNIVCRVARPRFPVSNFR